MEESKAAKQQAALGLLHQLGALVASLFNASEVLSDAVKAQAPTMMGDLFSADTVSRGVPASHVVEAAVSAALEVKADLSDRVALSAWCVPRSVLCPCMLPLQVCIHALMPRGVWCASLCCVHAVGTATDWQSRVLHAPDSKVLTALRFLEVHGQPAHITTAGSCGPVARSLHAAC